MKMEHLCTSAPPMAKQQLPLNVAPLGPRIGPPAWSGLSGVQHSLINRELDAKASC